MPGPGEVACRAAALRAPTENLKGEQNGWTSKRKHSSWS